MIISAKSLSGEYVSVEIHNHSKIEEEFERYYKNQYIDPKLRPFISVKLLKNEEEKGDWYFLVNTHNFAVCLERYKDYWLDLSQNPHPRMIEMLEESIKDEGEPVINFFYKYISRNPVAIEFLLKNPNKIVWRDVLYNERSYELLHLSNKYKNYMNREIIKYSADAYQLVCKNPRAEYINWDDFLKNKHVQPEWVQYVIDNEPDVYGECLYSDEQGRTRSAGDYMYTFRLTKVHWKMFSKMPVMIPLLKKYKDKICWKELCENPCADALEMMRENPDKIVISSMCNNHSKEAMSFLEEIRPDLDINKKSWSFLCKNPYAIDIINRYPSSIKYLELSKNTNEKAVEMVKNHLSIPTLSKRYRKGILRNLIENNSAGLLVLEMYERGYYYNYDSLDYNEYIRIILKQPYIFRPL